MKKNVTISITYNKYKCAVIEPEKYPNSHLTFSVNSNDLTIRGNKEGLYLLAESLIAVAESPRTDGYHLHIDDLSNINDEQKTFRIDIDNK